MKKPFYLLYATICYVVFLITFLYLIGFVANLYVPKSIDLVNYFDSKPWLAFLINFMLIALFGLQHSIMARQPFKNAIKKYIPTPIERSTYVLIASLVLMLLYYFWVPIPVVIWDFSNSTFGIILLSISFLGWGIVLLSTFLINHFHLFGLYQVIQYISNIHQKDEFKMPFLYKIVRHPLYLGFIIAFWATPTMTVGHLLFAMGMTFYILIGIHHEEKDLVNMHGESYELYRQNTPKLVPFGKGK
jgi:methanethiol S-methyltransferase